MSTQPENAARTPRRVTLIDGSGYIFRAFHALPPMTRPDGVPVNAVYGFTTMLMRLVEDNQADHLAVVFDAARKTFRNDLYDAYKAHRPPPPPELVPQFGLIRDAVRAFNVACVEHEGFEADDLIATYARRAVEAGATVTVISGDKDLMQLVSDTVTLWDPIKAKVIGPDQVREKFGVGPDKVVDVQSLAGDSADNVPGVPGIGVKTAAELITRFGDLDALLARAGEITQPKRRQTLIDHAGDAHLSRDLVRLRADVPLTVPLDDLVVREADADAIRAFLNAQAFRTILARFEARRGGAPASAPAAPAPDDPASRAPASQPPATPAAGLTTAAVPRAPAPATAEARYELVRTVADLDRWIARAQQAGVVAVDTETDALDALGAALVGVSLSVTPGEACYIPLRHVAPAAPAMADLLDPVPAPAAGDEVDLHQIPVAEALERLQPLLEDVGVLKVGHNIKYDMHILRRAAEAVLGRPIDVAPIDDTMVMSYVLDGSNNGHGMDELAQKHLGHTTIAFKDVCGSGRTQITFDKVPLDRACAYAAEDADITLRLHQRFRPRLLAEHMLSVYETLDRPLVPVLAAMERAGVLVDETVLRRLSLDFATRMGGLEQTIHGLAGGPFNVASPKQLGEILFDRMGLAGGKRSSKSGAYTTDAAVLETLAAQGHDLPARVLDWRQLAKLKSTYTDALLACRNPTTGRVHTSFAQAVTSTGRLSSNDPNLQNIPVRTEDGRHIRQAFIAPPGHVLLSADYSQIELRLVAHVADIQGLKDAFAAGADIHAVTASQVFGVPIEGMDPAVRRRAKAINFGIIYGISPFGLAAQLAIPQGEAKAFIDAYFERYPEIRAYMDETKRLARDQGYVTTLFGRKCYTRGINDRNAAARNFAERAAINAPIQGGAADIIKRAMAPLPAALTDAGLAARLLLQVHDELVLEVPEDEADATAAVVRRIMEGAARLSVPLVVDVGTGRDWASAH